MLMWQVERVSCNDITTNHPKLLYSSRKRLGEFVSRTLDIAKLTSQKKFVSFSDVHRLTSECAKSPLAVVAIDIAILKWVNFVAMDKTIKTYFFKSKKTELKS